MKANRLAGARAFRGEGLAVMVPSEAVVASVPPESPTVFETALAGSVVTFAGSVGSAGPPPSPVLPGPVEGLSPSGCWIGYMPQPTPSARSP